MGSIGRWSGTWRAGLDPLRQKALEPRPLGLALVMTGPRVGDRPKSTLLHGTWEQGCKERNTCAKR